MNDILLIVKNLLLKMAVQERANLGVADIDKENYDRMYRKFINHAIYVEKPLSITTSSESTSICQKYSSDDLLEVKPLKTKRCTCSVDPTSCPCHMTNGEITHIEKTENDVAPRAPEPRKTATINKHQHKLEMKIKISHTSVDSSEKDNNTVQSSMGSWLAKKDEERKIRQIKEKEIKEMQEKQREYVLQQERQNFQKWLMNKKKEEIAMKKRKEKELRNKELLELDKEKKRLQNELSYRLWLKKKEEASLEEKIKQQTKIIEEMEQKKESMKSRQEAFDKWLRESKTKQKPVALNKGLRTLFPESPVSYVNPTPWNPQI